MIELHTFRAAFGQPTGTPFGVKVLILLRMAGLEHEIVYQDDPRKAPKGKLPLIVDDGEVVADSTLIRHHLERTRGVDFDVGLTAEQKAASLAFQRLAEEHLYWNLVAARWLIEENWVQLRDAFFVKIPKIVRPLIANRIRKSVEQAMYGHGIGRHSLEEQFEMGARNLDAIAGWLGDKPFMHGPSPTAVDASVGAFVAAIVDDGYDSPLRQAARGHANLAAYAAGIKARFYPDGT